MQSLLGNSSAAGRSRALTCVQRLPPLAVRDMVRRVRLLIGHGFVPLAHSDPGRSVLGAKRGRDSARQLQPPTPAPTGPPGLPGPAALTLAQTADECRTRQAQSSPRLQASTCRGGGVRRRPGPPCRLAGPARTVYSPAARRTRAPPFWTERSAPRGGAAWGKGQPAATSDETKSAPARGCEGLSVPEGAGRGFSRRPSALTPVPVLLPRAASAA